MKKIIGYCRVSTKIQENAIGSQIFEIKRFSKVNNFTLIGLYSECKSGSCNYKEYGLLYKIVQEAIKNNADICVTEPSRLTRNLSIAKEIRKILTENNIKVIFINNIELFDNEKAYYIEFEHEERELIKISERTERGLRKCAACLSCEKYSKEEIKKYLITPAPYGDIPNIRKFDKKWLLKIARKAHIEALISQAEELEEDKVRNPFTGEKRWTAVDVCKLHIYAYRQKKKNIPQSQSLLDL